jgi:hypothetical protein
MLFPDFIKKRFGHVVNKRLKDLNISNYKDMVKMVENPEVGSDSSKSRSDDLCQGINEGFDGCRNNISVG